MTPQEKAKELLDKMTTNTNNETLMYKNKYAKECALVMIKEILNNSTFLLSYGELYYWQQVKQELEKL